MPFCVAAYACKGTPTFKIKGSGFGFRVQGSGFRIQGSGFKVQGSGFRVQGVVSIGQGFEV